MSLVRLLLIIVVIMLLFGGLGGHFGMWGAGPSPYTPFYGPSIGIGGILLIILIFWLVW
jgi:hypothetical protein